jgi:hypothetical protein
MTAGFPEWKINPMNFKEEGDQVKFAVQITGTHTQPLSLPMPGMPPIPPTGKEIRNPREPITATVRNGKVTRLEATVVPNGGVMGVLNQLGVQMPHMG